MLYFIIENLYIIIHTFAKRSPETVAVSFFANTTKKHHEEDRMDGHKRKAESIYKFQGRKNSVHLHAVSQRLREQALHKGLRIARSL